MTLLHPSFTPSVTTPARAVPPALTPVELLELVQTIAADRDAWLARVEHHADRRWFAQVRDTGRYDAWLIGWNTAQGVDLHDHGGSSGALCVLDGELVEVAPSPSDPAALTETRLVTGSARAFGRRHVHAVTNRTPHLATSLHVYSPPLRSMDFYAPAAGSGFVPVAHDDGSTW